MRYDILFSPQAVEDLRRLSANWRAIVRNALEVHLRYSPIKESKSRIKRFHSISHPQYRLRIDEIRVYYDVIEKEVEILAIILKSETDSWLEKEGK